MALLIRMMEPISSMVGVPLLGRILWIHWPNLQVSPVKKFRVYAATLTALFGAPHFSTPHLKGTGFSSWRPGSRADMYQ